MVMCSWVAFWIVKSDAAGRCSLGITTVLSVIKIGFGDKGKPQVVHFDILHYGLRGLDLCYESSDLFFCLRLIHTMCIGYAKLASVIFPMMHFQLLV